MRGEQEPVLADAASADEPARITGSTTAPATVIAAAATVADAAARSSATRSALSAIPKHVGGLRAGNATVNRDGSFTLNR